jgi:hypothetical protein
MKIGDNGIEEERLLLKKAGTRRGNRLILFVVRTRACA